jgi:hypothetical protein
MNLKFKTLIENPKIKKIIFKSRWVACLGARGSN